MKKYTLNIFRITLGGILFLSVTGSCLYIYSTYIWPAKASAAFVNDWSQRLNDIGSLSEIPSELRRLTYSQTFANGEWIVVAMDHSCCSGSGFNATVIKDSHGKIFYDTSHTFCGIEGMATEFYEVEVKSLEDFYKKTTFLKLKEK